MTDSVLGQEVEVEATTTEPTTEDIGGASEAGTTTNDETHEWLKGVEGLEEEYLKEPSLNSIKDIPGLVKSYVHAQKLIGKDKHVLPDENSGDEDWKTLAHKLGLPEDKEKYDIAEQVGEGEESVFDENQLANFKEFAYNNNLLPKQANQLLSYMRGQQIADEQKLEADASQELSDGIAALKEEWGDDGFDNNINKATTVVSEFGFEGLKEYFNETGIGNDPMLIRFLAKVGGSLTEDSFNSEAVGHLGLTKEEAGDKVMGMYAADHPYINSEHAEHAKAQKEMAKLQEILAK